MNSDSTVLMKNALQKRKAELQRLISQMKQDKLNTSTVYQKLEKELEEVRNQLTPTDRG